MRNRMPNATITGTLKIGNSRYPEKNPMAKQMIANRRNVTKGIGDPEYSYSTVLVVSDGCSPKTFPPCINQCSESE